MISVSSLAIFPEITLDATSETVRLAALAEIGPDEM